jgi:ABC-type oligopeptide transport system ATPase subunit
VLGIAGESGCGKSTLARMLLGLIEPSSGEAWITGQPIRTLAPRERARRSSRIPICPSIRAGASAMPQRFTARAV